MSKQTIGSSPKKRWWGFPLLWGLGIAAIVVFVFCNPPAWRRELSEGVLELLAPKTFAVFIFWLIPMMIVDFYVSKIWGSWGGEHSCF